MPDTRVERGGRVWQQVRQHQQRLRQIQQCMSQGKTLFGLDVEHQGRRAKSLIRFAECGPQGHTQGVWHLQAGPDISHDPRGYWSCAKPGILELTSSTHRKVLVLFTRDCLPRMEDIGLGRQLQVVLRGVRPGPVRWKTVYAPHAHKKGMP